MRVLKIETKITPRNQRGVELYLNSITPLKQVSPDEEAELGMRIKNGDKAAVRALVNANLRFVVSVAKQYQGYCNNFFTLLDIIQAGNEGMYKAALKFDPTRGFKFISYAVWWIRQSIQVEIDLHNSTVKLPFNISGNNRKMKVAIDNFYTNNGRMPNEAEIADFEIGKTCRLQISSMDVQLSDDQDSAFVWEKMPDTELPTDHFAEYEHTKVQIAGLLNRLTNKHQTILKHKYGICGFEKLSNEQIAQMYRTSPQSIDQIARTTIKTLRRSYAKQN